MFPIYFNENDTSKEIFTNNIVLNQRSLSSFIVDDSMDSKSVTVTNIALYGERISNVSAMTDVILFDDVIRFNDEFAKTYNYWDCSEVSQCEGFFLTALSVRI